MAVRGRDIVTGLPKEIIITDADIREAIFSSIRKILESAKEVIESTPPEVISDVMKRGLVLLGGGALIGNMAQLFEQELKLRVYIAEDPLSCVVRGTGFIVENLDIFADVLVENEDELPPV